MTAIKKRTKKERLVFIDGYASAILDIEEHGIEKAIEWLQIVAETEGHLKEDGDGDTSDAD